MGRPADYAAKDLSAVVLNLTPASELTDRDVQATIAPKFSNLTPLPKAPPPRKDNGGPPAKATPTVKPKPKKKFAERLMDKTREKRSKMAPAEKAENDRKSAEGRKRKEAETAAAPSKKRKRGDIKNLPDSEKAKIKCKFRNADESKNKCKGDPCPVKHV